MVVVTGWVLLFLGLGTGIGAVWLAALGGSLFYIVMAIGLIASGYLLIRRHWLARWVYTLFLLIVLIWAVWEVGFDWWALVPRGVVFTLIGLWLLLPWFGRTRASADTATNNWFGARGALGVVIALVAIVALISVSRDTFVIKGKLTGQSVAIASAEPFAGNDWPYYGGDRYGRRYSSLTDINPENAKKLKVAWTYHTGDNRLPSDPGETTFEVTPIKIANTLYLCTPHNHVIALDATTGQKNGPSIRKLRLTRPASI